MPHKGVVAAGHQLTAQAAADVLVEGGNAFDAMIAALFAACVAEPVLASLGGGGFLLFDHEDGRSGVLDFFVQTPRKKRPEAEIEFYPIMADFGTSQQEFHIGQGSIATPGMLRGLFAIHRQMGSLPMRDLVAPAIHLARSGVPLSGLQSYIFSVVAPIYLSSSKSRTMFESPGSPGKTLQEGEVYRNPDMADTLENLAIEGEDLFYRGEIAQLIAEQSNSNGGYLQGDDLEQYRVIERRPLEFKYRGNQLQTNPPPSSGGILIALAHKLIEEIPAHEWAHDESVRMRLVAEAMRQTSKARLDAHLDEATAHLESRRMLDQGFMERYRREVYGRAQAMRGTTHISVTDARGNIASATASNGEGCGDVIPGTGIMLNNMLGEEDINPHGFHRWQSDQRMTSMMAPTIVRLADGSTVATGSGGSNRIRSAIYQVLLGIMDQNMEVETAVLSPRIHTEGELLSIEGGFGPATLDHLLSDWPEHVLWEERNLFFGGVHTVKRDADGGFSGCGDPRRDGICLVV
jgi:gamma-glutamyltranspeptidase/glutathione hydrolase